MLVKYKRLLALILALGLLCGCFAGCEGGKNENPTIQPSAEASTGASEPSTEGTEATEPSGGITEPSATVTAPTGETVIPPTEPPTQTTDAPPSTDLTQDPTEEPAGHRDYLSGLSFSLIGQFQELSRQDDYASFHLEDVNVAVSRSSMAEEVGEGITTSEEFAQYYHDVLFDTREQAFAEKTLGEASGVHYILSREGQDVKVQVLGFYVQGNTGWIIAVSDYAGQMNVEDMIAMATSGAVDPDWEETPPEDVDIMSVTYKGLSLILDTSYEKYDNGDPNMACYGNGSTDVSLSFGPVSLWGEDISDAATLAQRYMAFMGWTGDITFEDTNGVSTALYTDAENGYVLVYGFYLLEDACWIVFAGGNIWDKEDMIILVSSGGIDESQVPPLPGSPDSMPPEEGGSQRIDFNGLLMDIGDSFELLYDEGNSIGYVDDAENSLDLHFGPLVTWGRGITDSASFAEYYVENMGFFEGEVTIRHDGPVSYILNVNDGLIMVYGFYVHDQVGWEVCATTYEAKDEAAMIGLATGGQIDEARIPDIEIPVLPDPGDTIRYEGLTLRFPVEVNPVWVDKDYLTIAYGDNYIGVSNGMLGDYSETAQTGAELVQEFLDQWALEYYSDAWVGEKNGVSYLVCRDGDSFTTVTGCYTDGSRLWMVDYSTYMDEAALELAIDFVTCGTVE
ncbi:MAG: hypothetical protein IJV82_02495 [Oscillospiraceae bacterium]|nr:hypothetical protein [Oscillospiraceae bacterium]